MAVTYSPLPPLPGIQQWLLDEGGLARLVGDLPWRSLSPLATFALFHVSKLWQVREFQPYLIFLKPQLLEDDSSVSVVSLPPSSDGSR